MLKITWAREIKEVWKQLKVSSVIRGQGRSKVLTTGQARVNPEHYVIKYMGG